MPAVNIIDTQDQVSNSGSASSGPSFRLPQRLAAISNTNTRKKVVLRM